MRGNAVMTTTESRTTMKKAVEVRPSTQPRCGLVRVLVTTTPRCSQVRGLRHEQVVAPLRRAVMHELHRLAPVRVREHQHGFLWRGLQPEAEVRADPVFRSPHA